MNEPTFAEVLKYLKRLKKFHAARSETERRNINRIGAMECRDAIQSAINGLKRLSNGHRKRAS